jgi:hypothetical protein
VKLREEYGGTIGAVVLTDSARVFYNHYNGRIDDVTKLGNYTNKPLTVRRVVIEMPFETNRYFVPYFALGTGSFNVVVTNGTTVNTKSITPTGVNSLISLNISPAAINAEYAGIITSATETYTVAVGGVTFTVKLICRGLYKNYWVHFLNRWGGYETMLFNKVSRKTYQIERKKWQQAAYRVDGAGVVTYKKGVVMHAQQTAYAGRFTEKLRLSTDWIYDSEYEWLIDLAASTVMYLDDNTAIYPAIQADDGYEVKENIVDSLTNLTITVEFGTSYKTQYV